MLMSLRQYARYRKEHGLVGGSPAAVAKALGDGRISRTRSGLIDSEAADKAWRANSAERPDSRGQLLADFRRGQRFIAQQVCENGRRLWLPFVTGELLHDESREAKLRVIAVFCWTIETWTARYVDVARLAGIDWSAAFGEAEGVAAARDYEALQRWWPSGPVLLAAEGSGYSEGCRWMAAEICAAGRQRWPQMIRAEIFDPAAANSKLGRTCEVHLLALMLAHVEGWLKLHIDCAALPAVEWFARYGVAAAAAEQEYLRFREEFAG